MKDATTAQVADFIRHTRFADLPADAMQAAKRSIYNWFGLVLHAAQHPAVNIARDWSAAFGDGAATAVGDAHKRHPMWASLINGLASHVEDYDDTHYATIIHPTGPVWSAILAVAEERGSSGAEALAAFVVGVDVECRVGEAVYPSHYDRGYHITATAGALGAAAGVCHLLRLETEPIEEALGLASTFASGLKGTFGSMAKPLHPGKAAMEGIMAAQLAQRSFTSGNTGLESRLGFCGVLSDQVDRSRIVDGLGERYLITENALKPFACGVVAHAAMDGILRHRAAGVPVPQITGITLRVHPRVQELTGNATPRDGLEGKFSVQHGVAVALLDGRAGPDQYTDARVQDPQVIALREKVTLAVDDSLRKDEAHVTVLIEGREPVSIHVEHALGSLQNPMSDQTLHEKVTALNPGLAPPQLSTLRSRIGMLDELPSVQPLAECLTTV